MFASYSQELLVLMCFVTLIGEHCIQLSFSTYKLCNCMEVLQTESFILKHYEKIIKTKCKRFHYRGIYNTVEGLMAGQAQNAWMLRILREHKAG
jgi:hypothetical protein